MTRDTIKFTLSGNELSRIISDADLRMKLRRVFRQHVLTETNTPTRLWSAMTNRKSEYNSVGFSLIQIPCELAIWEQKALKHEIDAQLNRQEGSLAILSLKFEYDDDNPGNFGLEYTMFAHVMEFRTLSYQNGVLTIEVFPRHYGFH